MHDEADRIATLIIAAVEGMAMCRAERSPRALDRIGEQLEVIVEDAIGRPRDGR